MSKHRLPFQDWGVYIFKREGKVLYVGMSKDVLIRIGEHINKNRFDFDQFEIKRVSNEFEARKLEAELIRSLNPEFNIIRPSGIAQGVFSNGIDWENKTDSMIAQEIGLSRERVRQARMFLGIPPSKNKRKRKDELAFWEKFKGRDVFNSAEFENVEIFGKKIRKKLIRKWVLAKGLKWISSDRKSVSSYAELRKRIGTRSLVSKLLGVNRKTIERRELGHSKVNNEMELALKQLGSQTNERTN